MDKEIRYLQTKVELRQASEAEKPVIEAYALKFNRWSENLGYYSNIFERIDPKALNEADMSNVVALFNHRQDFVLGRTGVNVELEVDGIGLKWRCTPTDTTYARDLIENIRAGVINQCSFAFSLEEDGAEEWKYNKEEDKYERTILKIKRLHDVSIVTTPAYSDTEAVISERSKEKLEQIKRDNQPKENRDKMYEYQYKLMEMGVKS